MDDESNLHQAENNFLSVIGGILRSSHQKVRADVLKMKQEVPEIHQSTISTFDEMRQKAETILAHPPSLLKKFRRFEINIIETLVQAVIGANKKGITKIAKVILKHVRTIYRLAQGESDDRLKKNYLLHGAYFLYLGAMKISLACFTNSPK